MPCLEEIKRKETRNLLPEEALMAEGAGGMIEEAEEGRAGEHEVVLSSEAVVVVVHLEQAIIQAIWVEVDGLADGHQLRKTRLSGYTSSNF